MPPVDKRKNPPRMIYKLEIPGKLATYRFSHTMEEMEEFVKETYPHKKGVKITATGQKEGEYPSIYAQARR